MPSNKRGRGRDAQSSTPATIPVVAYLVCPPEIPAVSNVPIEVLEYEKIQPSISSRVGSPLTLSASLSSSSSDVISTPATPVTKLSLAQLRSLRTELDDIRDAVVRQRTMAAFQASRLSTAIAMTSEDDGSAIVALPQRKYIAQNHPLASAEEEHLLQSSSFCEPTEGASRKRRRGRLMSSAEAGKKTATKSAPVEHDDEEMDIEVVDIDDGNVGVEKMEEEPAPVVKTEVKKKSHSRSKNTSKSDSKKKKKKTAKVKKEKGEDSDEDPPMMTSTNQFWTTIEPFISSITEDHLQWLMPQDHKDDDAFRIPKLGKHYTEVWAAEDLNQDDDYSTRRSSSKRGSRRVVTDTQNPGDFTRRILSALVHENLIESANLQGTEFDSSSDTPLDESVASSSSRAEFVQLEERIKMELRSIGVLDLDEEMDLSQREDDEVCAEIRSIQRQLREQIRVNNQRRAALFSKAILKMKEQVLQRRSKAIQAALEDIYLMKKRRRRHRRAKRANQKG